MKIRALLVDDCPLTREVIKQLINFTGLAEFQFTEAGDGVEALEKFDPKKFDVMFVDWNLPRLSGLEFAHRVRVTRKCAHIPVVVISGERTVAKVQEALEYAGVSEYITKPVDLEDLALRLQRVIQMVREAKRKHSLLNHLAAVGEMPVEAAPRLTPSRVAVGAAQ